MEINSLGFTMVGWGLFFKKAVCLVCWWSLDVSGVDACDDSGSSGYFGWLGILLALPVIAFLKVRLRGFSCT